MSPTHVRKTLRQASFFKRTGRLKEARKLYRRVISAHPKNKDALKACAVISLQLNLIDEAVALLQRAVSLDEADSGAQNDYGNVLQAAGRIDDAIAAYRYSVKIDSRKAETHFNLGNALRTVGNLEGAAAAYHQAEILRPNYVNAKFQLGLVLHAQGYLDAAAKQFREVLEIDVANSEASFALGNVLYSAEKLDGAMEAYAHAAKSRPEVFDGSFEVGKPRHVHAYFDRGEPEAALRACDSYLARRPGQSCALALKAIALNELGERDAVRKLLDFDDLLCSVHLNPPPSYESLEAFNAALESHISGHSTLMDAPENYSMQGGKSTGELFVSDEGPISDFKTLLEFSVISYCEALPKDPTHPFLVNNPDSIKITAWGVILNDGAYQVPHIHPSAWLSGVYYVRLPNIINANSALSAGYIKFGQPYWDFKTYADLETKLIRPEEGLMLLFPSYMFHSTLPFSSKEHRVSIAFDIFPSR